MNVVVWHDVECGDYVEDLPLWRELAEAHEGPILDVGAGTGRVTLDLAARGHEVVALDADAALLAALRERNPSVETVVADARSFSVPGRRFGLVIVPMQTLQLFDGHEGREAFLRAAHAHMAPGATLAAALADPTDGFDEEHTEPPLPDIRELDGTVYHSQVVAVRAWPEATRIERIRQTVDLAGHRTSAPDVITLDRVDAAAVAAEAEPLGFDVLPARRIAMTELYVGSEVVMLCRRA